jgi:hypothetical protein
MVHHKHLIFGVILFQEKRKALLQMMVFVMGANHDGNSRFSGCYGVVAVASQPPEKTRVEEELNQEYDTQSNAQNQGYQTRIYQSINHL